MASKSKSPSKNPISQGTSFVQESVQELKKVQFPTKQETIQTSIIVIVMLVAVAAFLGFWDMVFSEVMSNVLG